MFAFAILSACSGKQTEPAVAIEEPAETPAEAEPVEAEPAEAAPAEGEAADCPEGAVVYTQLHAPLSNPEDVSMHWTLTIHDSGLWQIVSPKGTEQGCLSEEELTNLNTELASVEVAAPPLEPGMARCMAMPMTQHTVTIGDQSATWKGPCGMNNPSDSLDALMNTVASVSYKRP